MGMSSLRTQTYFRLSLVFAEKLFSEKTSDSRKYVCVRRLGNERKRNKTNTERTK